MKQLALLFHKYYAYHHGNHQYG